MDFFFKGLNEASNCSFNEKDIQRCPFLRNIDKPTNFAFFSVNFPVPVSCQSHPYIDALTDLSQREQLRYAIIMLNYNIWHTFI